jgi:Dolichyl-phosphate-mannose-protein mannosyltransferase
VRNRLIAPADQHWLFSISPGQKQFSRRQKIFACLALLLVAIIIRSLYWQDNQFAFSNPTPDPYSVSIISGGMPTHYRNDAQLLLQGDLHTFIYGPAPPTDANILMHPPGYPILSALASKVFDGSDQTMRFIHLIVTSACPVIVFLIAIELFPAGTAVFSGMLTALSPQLAFYSLALRPDNLVPLPLLLALYFTVRATRRSAERNVVIAGACMGLACWLRSDTMLFAPFLALFFFHKLFERRRLRFSLILVCVTILVVLPITIRNFVAFRAFIPVSLGGGVTFVQGIAEYDKERRFGLPSTDFETLQMESRQYNRPDYLKDLFNPDGIARERWRVNQGLNVVTTHPLWFSRVMIQRMVSMLRYERVPLISARQAVTQFGLKPRILPTWTAPPEKAILRKSGRSAVTQTLLGNPQQSLRISGGDSEPAQQITFPQTSIRIDTAYLLTVPIKVDAGSATIYVESSNTGERLASTATLVPLASLDHEGRPLAIVRLPFVSGKTDRIQICLDIGGKDHTRAVQIGEIELFTLGPATMQWTHFARVPIRIVQAFFLTAWMLPLLLLGICFLAITRQKTNLMILSAIPTYYLTSHALFHTEYRMVLSIQYSYLMLAGVAVYGLLSVARNLHVRLASKS